MKKILHLIAYLNIDVSSIAMGSTLEVVNDGGLVVKAVGVN